MLISLGLGSRGGSLGSIWWGTLMDLERGSGHRGSNDQRVKWSAGGSPNGPAERNRSLWAEEKAERGKAEKSNTNVTGSF